MESKESATASASGAAASASSALSNANRARSAAESAESYATSAQSSAASATSSAASAASSASSAASSATSAQAYAASAQEYAAELTAQKIANVLGYTPADAEGLANTDQHIAEDIEPDINALYAKNVEQDDAIANKVGKTDYAGNDAGIIYAKGWYNFTSNNGIPYVLSRNYSQYSSDSVNNFIGKGTLENVLDNETIRTDKAQSLTDAQKNQAKANLEKEWVLKGTMTEASGITLDLSGCTEILLDAYIVGTANSNLNLNFGGQYFACISTAVVNGTRYIQYYAKDIGMAICPISSRYGSTANAITNQTYALMLMNKTVSGITGIRFGNTANVTSCEIKIYAR